LLATCGSIHEGTKQDVPQTENGFDFPMEWLRGHDRY